MCDDLYLYFVSSWRERRENRVEDRRQMSRRTTTQKKKKNDGRSKLSLKRPPSSWQPTLKHYFGGKVDINVASVHIHT